MDFDLTLTKSLKENAAVLRFYQWEPYSISLGANQAEEVLIVEKIHKDNIDIVKRPTGGRAILHSEELTYSVIYQLGIGLSPRDLYREINIALNKGLIIFDDILKKLELNKSQPYFPKFYNEEKSAVCFSVSSMNEINFGGKKLVGSAQRRIGNVVLQHGSILCGSYHKNICDYLKLSVNSISALREELDKGTTDLNEILKRNIDIESLAEAIKIGFEKHFDISYFNCINDFEQAQALN